MVGESCSCEWLSEKLVSSDDGILLLDCRALEEYRASHVRGSIHVTVPSIMLRRLRAGSVSVTSVVSSNDRAKFTERYKSDSIVLYDGSGDVSAQDGEGKRMEVPESTPPVSEGNHPQLVIGQSGGRSEVVSLLMNRLRNDGCRVFHLQGGFHDFRQKYGHLCVGEDQTTVDSQPRSDGDHVISLGLTRLRLSENTLEEAHRKEGRATPGSAFPFPVQVMPYLYLGNAENSADLACLNRHGIRYILNVTADIPNTFAADDKFKYLQIPITDNLSQNLNVFFPAAIAFIDEARNQGCGALVHCLAGISRSVTITVAYLMFTKSMSLNDAYDYLRKCKPNISPNFNFMGQLLDFEVILQQRTRCPCYTTTTPGTEHVDTVATPCVTCRNIKTYFSTPTLPFNQSQTTEGAETSPSVLPQPTSSPASLAMSSTSSSSLTSISSLTSDCA